MLGWSRHEENLVSGQIVSSNLNPLKFSQLSST